MVSSPGRLYKADNFGNVNGQPWTDKRLPWVVTTSAGGATVADIQGNTGRFERTGTALQNYNDFGVALLDVRDIGPNYEVYVEYQLITTAEQFLTLSVRRSLAASGTQPNSPADGFLIETAPADGVSTGFNLSSAVASVQTNLVNSTAETWINSAVYALRAVVDGAYIRAKTWRIDDAGVVEEPNNWSIDFKSYLHFASTGRNYVSIGTTGGAAGNLQNNWRNFRIARLDGHQFATRRKYWIPAAAGGNNYVEDVVCTVTGTTSETDLLAATENVVCTVTGTTSETDLLALTESVTCNVSSTTSETDLLAMFENPVCTVVVTNPGSDTLAGNENWTCNVAGTTSESDILAGVENVVCNVVSTTSETDSQAGLESVLCTINGSTSESDVLGFTEIVTCNITGTTSETDTLGAFENLVCSVTGTTSESDTLAANETPVCNVSGSTSGSDSLGGLENLVCAVTGTTSETDILAMLESVLCTVTVTTGGLGMMAAVEDWLCLINATTSETDILNDEPPPLVPVLVYAAAPWKVSGFR